MITKVHADDEAWERLQNANSIDLSLFFNNVDWLSRKRFGSRYMALKRLHALGYAGRSYTVTKYKKKKERDCMYSNLSKWGLLFNLPVYLMLSVDYSKEEEGV